ncbi:MAG TPA: MFS transporter, partial [Lacipirellulaceae bacterium]|nr:MFS transporter [Lacipirellulaceae bacterium]
NIGAATALTYGLSKFLMGAVSDRSDPRRFMSVGLLLTAICNFAFGASSNYQVHFWLWALNGFFQGMGWPPCGRVMGHWFSESERGLTFSIWNTSHNVGGGIAGLIAAWGVQRFGGWQYAFFVPGIIASIGSVYLFVRLRDTPQSVGLPPIEEYQNDFPVGGIPEAELERQLSYRELVIEKVLLNPYVWLLAVANFFAYIARYSLIDWGPTYLRVVKGASLTEGSYVQTAIEFGGIPSTIFFGWISDRLGGRRAMVATLCMLPIVASYAVIALLPAGYFSLYYVLFVAIGCFIYPVINLITIAALDNVSKKAIGTAAGFIGLLGYIGKSVEYKWIGRFVDQYSSTLGVAGAWSIVLYAILTCAGIATILLALMWKLRPRA